MSVALPILAAHMVGDYVTQNDWMAANKLRSWKVRAVHVTVYTLGFIPVVLMAAMSPKGSAAFLALIWVTHFITDCRRWAKGDKWPPKPILVDQTIHIATLAVLAYAFQI